MQARSTFGVLLLLSRIAALSLLCTYVEATPAHKMSLRAAQVSSEGDIPATFQPDRSTFDFVRRDAMIPMRDGVRLYTVIVIPKRAAKLPMMLIRTPYDAGAMLKANGPHLDASLEPIFSELVDRGYILVARPWHHAQVNEDGSSLQ